MTLDELKKEITRRKEVSNRAQNSAVTKTDQFWQMGYQRAMFEVLLFLEEIEEDEVAEPPANTNFVRSVREYHTFHLFVVNPKDETCRSCGRDRDHRVHTESKRGPI